MASGLDKQYQTLIVLWFALLMNIGVFFVVSVFIAPATANESGEHPSSFLTITLTALGTFLVLGSFAVKQKLLRRSVETQNTTLVQKALVVACAMCEFSALLGLLERFIVGNRAYYLLFLLGAVGTALHFPRRSQLESASYKSLDQLS